ncbi:MAG: hypothetical protein JWM55_134 [Acidimicrobiaceae bacterium]|nr:hypothetical protein [Acidimicrobiaceae bacterium]
MKRVASWLARALKGFGLFWWDFLVGDTPEITVVVLLILGVVALASEVAHLNVLAYVALPVLAIAALTISVARARRTKS